MIRNLGVVCVIMALIGGICAGGAEANLEFYYSNSLLTFVDRQF